MDPQNDSAVAETPTSRPKAEDAVKAAEKAAGSIQRRGPAHGLPVRQYLESTVVPVLMQALQSLCKERPDDPVEYIANYLLQHNPKKNEPATQRPPASDSVAQPAQVGSSKA